MKCIRKEKDDGSWHKMNVEMPNSTSNVEVKKLDGTIEDAEIVVDMAGFYIYLRNERLNGWGNLSDYSHWKFKAK